MAERRALEVAFFINVRRDYGDARSDADLLRAFRSRFERDIWPGERLPATYYDPRALELGPDRACLHAKCLVVDRRWALVTSANFTEAAQLRNLEAGVLLDDPSFAGGLARQLEGLLHEGRLGRLPAGSQKDVGPGG